MGNRTYSPEFKLQVVLEALQSDGTDAEVARAYDIHPVTLSGWKTNLKENGSKAFGGGDELKEKKDKIAQLERMAGKRMVGRKSRSPC
jgi:transposase-like protein